MANNQFFKVTETPPFVIWLDSEKKLHIKVTLPNHQSETTISGKKILKRLGGTLTLFTELCIAIISAKCLLLVGTSVV